MAEADFLSVSEAARVLDRSAQTVRAWADTGKLPVMRMRSGERLFKPADVERVRDEQRTAPGNEAA